MANDVKSRFQEGMQCLHSGDFQGASKKLEQLADEGINNAMIVLNNAYTIQGWPYPLSGGETGERYIYRRLNDFADKNNPNAMIELGGILIGNNPRFDKNNFPTDPDAGIKMIEKGIEVAMNGEKPIGWIEYQAAADMFHTRAKQVYAELNVKKNHDEFLYLNKRMLELREKTVDEVTADIKAAEAAGAPEQASELKGILDLTKKSLDAAKDMYEQAKKMA